MGYRWTELTRYGDIFEHIIQLENSQWIYRNRLVHDIEYYGLRQYEQADIKLHKILQKKFLSEGTLSKDPYLVKKNSGSTCGKPRFF